MISATDKEGSAAQGVPDPLREPGSGRLGGLLPGHQVRSPDRERGAFTYGVRTKREGREPKTDARNKTS